MRGWLAPLILTMAALLGACATAPPYPTTLRQALLGLSEQTSLSLLAEPVWQRPTPEVVLLMASTEVDASLEIDPERLEESLTRALLAQPGGPQVLNWDPRASYASAPDNHWMLETALVADGPRLRLSDRNLLPYRLTLTLRHPGQTEPHRILHLQGAFDATAL